MQPEKKKIISFGILAAIILAIPLTVFIAQKQQDIRQRAATTFTPEIDSYTKELYDFQVQSTFTLQTGSSGPLYRALTTFRISGPRANTKTQLVGFLRKEPGNGLPSTVSFTYNPTGAFRFISQPIQLIGNDCIDLYAGTEKVETNYVATFCYKNNELSPGSNKVVYAYNGNPMLYLDYAGTSSTMIQFLTSAFDKNNFPNLGFKVNYFTPPSEFKHSNFTNVRYNIQGVLAGTNDQTYNEWCQQNSIYPKKYLKFSQKVSGDTAAYYEITSPGQGGCSFSYTSPSFITSSFVSLHKGTPPATAASMTSLTLSPNTATINVGNTLTTSISLNAGVYNISGIDFVLSYSTAVFDLVSFSPSSSFNSKLINNPNTNTGKIHYAAIDTTNISYTGNVPIGTLTLRAKAPNVTTISFQSVQVTGLAYTGQVPNGGNTMGVYTVNAVPTATPTPTRIPTNTPTLFPTATSIPVSPTTAISFIAADVNKDGSINLLDYNRWRDEYLKVVSTQEADLNKDGVIDLLDFSIWRNAFQP